MSERMSFHPTRDRLADGGSRILLDEMRPRYRDLGLVLPAAAELPDRPDQDGAGLGIDEKLWDVVLAHPLRVIGGDGDDIGRFARNRDLPRPGQRRPTVVAVEEGFAIFRHFGVREFPE